MVFIALPLITMFTFLGILSEISSEADKGQVITIPFYTVRCTEVFLKVSS